MWLELSCAALTWALSHADCKICYWKFLTVLMPLVTHTRGKAFSRFYEWKCFVVAIRSGWLAGRRLGGWVAWMAWAACLSVDWFKLQFLEKDIIMRRYLLFVMANTYIAIVPAGHDSHATCGMRHAACVARLSLSRSNSDIQDNEIPRNSSIVKTSQCWFMQREWKMPIVKQRRILNSYLIRTRKCFIIQNLARSNGLSSSHITISSLCWQFPKFLDILDLASIYISYTYMYVYKS